QRRESYAELHRVQRAARYQDDRRVRLEALVEHVHRAEVQRDGVVRIRLRGLAELLGDLALRITEDNARLSLAFCLRLHRHRVLETGWDQDIPDLDGDHVDTPWFGARVD